MSNKQNNLIWGGVLIILGALFLLENLNLIPVVSPAVWAIGLGLACIAFLAVYVARGKEHWGWLFPIFISGGLAVSAALSLTSINPLWIGGLFMASISAPFWLVFLFNYKENWWALIPAWATAILSFIILVSELWSGEMIAALILWAIALPFIVIFLRNRVHWWALIPGFVILGAGVVVLLANQSMEEAIGTFVLLVVAFPFFAIFFFAKGNWWAIIPAGMLATLALLVPFAIGVEENSLEARLVAAAMFLGFILPFGWLWWRRDRYSTAWAKYPAVGLFVAAVVTLALGTDIEFGWPAILIVIGVWLLIDNLRQPKIKS